MKVIVQQNKEGKVLITTVSADSTLERVLNSLPEDIVAFIADSEDLPSDATFFDAWEVEDKEVVVNLTKAKEIWKNKIRQARKPILEKLDVEYIKALENEDSRKVKEVVSLKKELRDITDSKELSKAKSAKDIKSFWPSILQTD